MTRRQLQLWPAVPVESDWCQRWRNLRHSWRHRSEGGFDADNKVAKAYPRRELHVVLDNYHTHKHDDINRRLAKNPRVRFHFTPTSGSWLNLVEVFFGIITRQAIRRGSFDSVRQLITAISTFIEGWNDRCHPFSWTKTADELLPHATREQLQTRDTRPGDPVDPQALVGQRSCGQVTDAPTKTGGRRCAQGAASSS
jgi:hypothetical protein